MNISENAVLYYTAKYESFSLSVAGKDKEGNKYVTYIPVLLTDKDAKKVLIKKLGVHESTACKIFINKGFVGCFKTKLDEVKIQAVIQDFSVEEFYSKGK